MDQTDNDAADLATPGGSYELLRRRLADYAGGLRDAIDAFDQSRQATFGASGSALIGKANAVTPARCVPVDMTQVGDLLLFGYQVFVGMRQVPALGDVFGLYRLVESDDGYRLDPVPLTGSFLDQDLFVHSFRELFTYYQEARLVQIGRRDETVYAAFRIGRGEDDLRVYRWRVTANGVDYVDDQGRPELTAAPQHDVDWQSCTRDDQVLGLHPHVSVMDRVFVECIGGDLTIKVENNTRTGRGIYSEPVEDPHQTIGDASIRYAEIGGLILLAVRPHRERAERFFIFDPLVESVYRADAIAHAVKRLPEGHGLLFPNGYALAGGVFKRYDDLPNDARFFEQIAAPNAEDMLYAFYDALAGAYVLHTYNLINKRFEPPLVNHGYSLFDDGRLLVFRLAENAEPASIHPLRVWRTPFMSADCYARAQAEASGGDGAMRQIGNAELVRAISELNTIVALARGEASAEAVYQALIEQCRALLDRYHWLDAPHAAGLAERVGEVAEASERIIDEFAKVQALRQRAEERLAEHIAVQQALITRVKLTGNDRIEALIERLGEVKTHLGHAIGLRDERHLDPARVAELTAELERVRDDLDRRLIDLLAEARAYAPFYDKIDAIEDEMARADKAVDLSRLADEAATMRARLALVDEEVTGIETDDATRATRILDLTASLMARLNGVDASLRNRLDAQRTREAEAEFAAQLKLLSQGVAAALSEVDTPEAADRQLARLLGLIERIEARSADFDRFLIEIAAKRDEIQSAFATRKEQLVAERTRRIEHIVQTAEVTLSSIESRVAKLEDEDALHAFFAGDAIVARLRRLSDDLRRLDATSRADALDGGIKALQDQSLRALRDRRDIFEQGGAVLRLGAHRFSVEPRVPEVALVTRDGSLYLHVSGTEYYEPVKDQALLESYHLAAMDVVSEGPDVYRGEYLAYSVLRAAETGRGGLSLDALDRALAAEGLDALVADFAAPLYREGYIKGVHDRDAAALLAVLYPIYRDAGLLRFAQPARAHALLWLAELDEADRDDWSAECRQALLLAGELGSRAAIDNLVGHARTAIEEAGPLDLPGKPAGDAVDPATLAEAAEYVVEWFGQPVLEVVLAREGHEIAQNYLALRQGLGWRPAGTMLGAAFADHLRWLAAYTARHGGDAFAIDAALAATLRDHPWLKATAIDFALECTVSGLLGRHARIEDGALSLTLDDFLARCRHHAEVTVPAYEAFVEQRRGVTAAARKALRLTELRPKPLTTFVRNRLISDSYLPLIGANLAKQMGALGSGQRSDRMGLLLLISPPGYGKTTLIEYLASKLGLNYVKIDCTAIGQDVTSLDPARAPSATSRREIEKLNLAFELGNNVLLYLDDIQHTSPEFLQRFISLADGTRRIEGVWRGAAKGYDLKGKRFAVIMAGNPYTESGTTFKIPDMLANRADIYNLGDMLSDQRDVFELSYIENSLTSNPVLAPLTGRDMEDLYRFMRMVRGEEVRLSDMTYGYSPAESAEIVAVLERLMKIQAVVLEVNQAYISSAATATAYRTEPPFKLQGSYRNMNKLAEQVVAVMTDDDLQRLVGDHYYGEAQTLASGTEENLLKLGELLDVLDEEEKARWEEIKSLYRRARDRGGDGNPAAQAVAHLEDLNRHLSVVAYALYQRHRREGGDQPAADWLRHE